MTISHASNAGADTRSASAPTNRLLGALSLSSPSTHAWLAARLTPVNLAQGHMLLAPHESLPHVCFPESAVASVICRMTDGGAAEVGTIGLEGFVGVNTILGGSTSPNEIVIQVAGTALLVEADVLMQGTREHPALRDLLLRYALEYLTQVSQTAACNRLHSLDQRCARWLLMTHDRTGLANAFGLTQEYLAIMLGVRRSGVTVAAGALQDAGIIRYRRGRIEVLDRARLEAEACECYAVVQAQFDRLFPD